ncbi:MAG: translation initiation factor IF-3 [Limisphaerales bacterium]
MSRPFPPRSSSSSGPFVRVNGKIRAREVRLIGEEGKQFGVMALGEALNLARAKGVDLVEIAPNATPPVCRLVDYGKFRYEQAKREKESKKNQHATKVKEVQLSPKIDPHDLAVKTEHAIDFLCEDMKIKVTLKFRGREMAHTQYGFQVVQKFLADVAPFGHPDFEPKLIGRGINVMISPLPRNKRPGNSRLVEGAGARPAAAPAFPEPEGQARRATPAQGTRAPQAQTQTPVPQPSGFSNNPFAQLEVK